MLPLPAPACCPLAPTRLHPPAPTNYTHPPACTHLQDERVCPDIVPHSGLAELPLGDVGGDVGAHQDLMRTRGRGLGFRV